jgi:hypothetical protein
MTGLRLAWGAEILADLRLCAPALLPNHCTQVSNKTASVNMSNTTGRRFIDSLSLESE